MESTGCFYQSFYQTYGQMSLESQLIALQDILEKLLHWIDSLSEDELFLPQQRAWRLPKHNTLWKWIHINSVALLLVSERNSQMEKSVSLKVIHIFFKKLDKHFKFSTENFVDEISCFSKNFSTMLICSTLNLCKF